MKEIDFLPEWYRSGRRRQVSYRAQCIALSGVFVVMVVWSLAATHSLSKAQAELTQMTAADAQAEEASVESAALESELKQLRQQVQSVQAIDSRIDVASVLAELSFLIDQRVILSRVDFGAEKLALERKGGPQIVGAVVQPVGMRVDDKKSLPLGHVRFRVVIAGVAADASDVGDLMCKLEDSPYFWQVSLAYSRDTEVVASRSAGTTGTAAEVRDKPAEARDNVGQAGASVRASEFEIHCYLANYRQM